MTPAETFVLGVYASLDGVTAGALEQLSREQGVVPSCRSGCSHCCRFLIPTSRVEIHALAQFIKRTFDRDRIEGLRARTRQWHDWDQSRPGRHRAAEIPEPVDLEGYDPCCPLLVRGACSAYPMRPIICRTHFVRSNPSLCLAATQGRPSKAVPVTLPSVVAAAHPLSIQIKAYVEAGGVDFSRSIVLLPHGLAMEMEWDFALSP
jgi:hypothetical protein